MKVYKTKSFILTLEELQLHQRFLAVECREVFIGLSHYDEIQIIGEYSPRPVFTVTFQSHSHTNRKRGDSPFDLTSDLIFTLLDYILNPSHETLPA
jgi:hypothetical protein